MNFNLRRISYLTLVTVLFFTFQSCNKQDVTASTNERGGLALTFDDYNIDNWYTYIDLLDSFNVKATFYVSNYNKLNVHQKAKLHEIQNRGHEIAFHSTNHVNF